jgi:biopolymer transport protein TolQ
LNVHTDLSFLSLITQASIVVQAVMLLLAGLSLWSWWQIFLKRFQLSRAERETATFEDQFWKGGDLNELYQSASQSRTGSGLQHIFTAGFREYSKHRRQGSAAVVTLDSARRAMRAAYQREIDAIEAHLSGLATVGSVSPYIGLFGTVWGIMNAFLNIAEQQDTSLGTVAGPIAEALFATGLGLVAAIPAVIFYNKFTSDLTQLADQLDAFSQDVLVRLSRRASDATRD